MKVVGPMSLLLVLILSGWILVNNRRQAIENQVLVNQPNSIPSNCIPTFSDGGGPYYQNEAPFRNVLAPENHTGEQLIVTGRVLKSDCQTPLPNAVVDIWQANESGNYEDEWYRGRIRTNNQGEYLFTTVVPQGYGQGTGYRPPHVHFKIWHNDQLLITSQMFLPESRQQGIEEAYIIQVDSTTENGQPMHRGAHDIVVPGI